MGAGYGQESFNDEALRQTFWRAGAMEYIPPETAYLHTTEVDTDWLSVTFELHEWMAFFGSPATNGSLLRCDAGLQYANFQALVHAAHRCIVAAPDERLALQQALGVELADHYRQAVVPASRSRRTGSLSFATLTRVADLVESRLPMTIGLAQLAKEARLSKFHFISAFRLATGVTPHQYVLARRLNRAQKLLRRCAMPVTVVALECGFSSHAHLTAAFTARFGVSPTKYRRAG